MQSQYPIIIILIYWSYSDLFQGYSYVSLHKLNKRKQILYECIFVDKALKLRCIHKLTTYEFPEAIIFHITQGRREKQTVDTKKQKNWNP